ncbi:hypothetical protein Cenrod_0164 [Candidatus Symbiobacter mobilis CR]|uniref:Uncharacterized protein n=1 Tax=Candidatus Symbiobacter mobilis CR TaxID=946483 RepID=U5N486_9BURK|nr:hypothetical protein Cenrod_0164 [Candidatus Symbiobacter mobilis CR]
MRNSDVFGHVHAYGYDSHDPLAREGGGKDSTLDHGTQLPYPATRTACGSLATRKSLAFVTKILIQI